MAYTSVYRQIYQPDRRGVTQGTWWGGDLISPPAQPAATAPLTRCVPGLSLPLMCDLALCTQAANGAVASHLGVEYLSSVNQPSPGWHIVAAFDIRVRYLPLQVCNHECHFLTFFETCWIFIVLIYAITALFLRLYQSALQCIFTSTVLLTLEPTQLPGK